MIKLVCTLVIQFISCSRRQCCGHHHCLDNQPILVRAYELPSKSQVGRTDCFEGRNFKDYMDSTSSWNFGVFFMKTINSTNEKIFNAGEILKIIWDTIGGRDKSKLALFVASSLHNTSNYKVFEEADNSSDRYKSRGLLMIRGKENYKLLSHLSATEHDYMCDPKRLSSVNEFAIRDTIEFWEYKMEHNYTFNNMMKSFKIKNWMENRWETPDIKNWREMYEKLKLVYFNE